MTKKPTTLAKIFAEHTGNVSDKWSIYITEYDRLFQPYHDQPVSLLEIGIQNGGSLEIWAKFFTKANKFIGCDINPACAQLTFDDPRIAVVVSDANIDETQQLIDKLSPDFDLIIDDGSHHSSDIVRSFFCYFTRLKDGGLYIAEDLHCSYWQDYEGGLYQPYSSIAFFKQLADIINHEHWGIDKTRSELLKKFNQQHNTSLDEINLAHIHSIEFINSICVVRKEKPADNMLGLRLVTGTIAIVNDAPLLLNGSNSTQPNQSDNQWSLKEIPFEEELTVSTREIASLRRITSEQKEEIIKVNQTAENRQIELNQREKAYAEQLQEIQQAHAQQTNEQRLEQMERDQVHVEKLTQTRLQLEAQLRELNEREKSFVEQLKTIQQAHVQQTNEQRRKQAEHEQELTAQLAQARLQLEAQLRELNEREKSFAEQLKTIQKDNAQQEIVQKNNIKELDQANRKQLYQVQYQLETNLTNTVKREKLISHQLQAIRKTNEQQKSALSSQYAEREQVLAEQLTQIRLQLEAQLREQNEREKTYAEKLQTIQRTHAQQSDELHDEQAERDQVHGAELTQARLQLETQLRELIEREKAHTEQLQQTQQAHAQHTNEQRCEQAEREQVLAEQLTRTRQQLENQLHEMNECEKAFAEQIQSIHQAHTQQTDEQRREQTEREQVLADQLTKASQQLEIRLDEQIEREKEFAEQLQEVQQAHAQQTKKQLLEQIEQDRTLNTQLLEKQDELYQLTRNWLEAEQVQTKSLNQLRDQLNAIHSSFSWRWTAPLRQLTGLLNKDVVDELINRDSAVLPDQRSKVEKNDTLSMHSAKSIEELLSYYDEEFIKCAYQTFLGRVPDTEGFNYYLDRIRKGISKTEIIYQIRSGYESKVFKSYVTGVNKLNMRHNLLKIPFFEKIFQLTSKSKMKNTVQINQYEINRNEFEEINKEKNTSKLKIERETKIEMKHEIELEIVKDSDNEETRIKNQITASGLFDANWYLDYYPDLKNAEVDPLHHYIEHGAFEGRWPSAFFHSDYYLNNYIDIREANVNPLVHYINYGESEGRKPSRFFDPSWYREKYGIDAKLNNTYLMHFTRNGGFKTNPSPYFDAIRYFVDAPDVMKAGVNPLAHYLSSGIREGRRAMPTETYQKATEAQLVILKNTLIKFDRVAIFVTYTPDGFLRADIKHYINALTKNNVEVALVIVSDQVRNYIPADIMAVCSTVIVRENAGFDFAAWAHVMQAVPEVLNSKILYLLNDSMIGPVSDIEFKNLLIKIDDNEAEIVGLTSNGHISSHIQSFFLSIKKKALSSYWLIQYFTDIVNLPTKDDVIFQYELTFTARMKAKGFNCASIISASSDNINATIFKWGELLESGIPFVKRSLISGEHEDKGGKFVIEALEKCNYPVSLLSKRIPDLIEDKSIFLVHLRGHGEFQIEQLNALIEPAKVNKLNSKFNKNITFISAHNYANGLGMAGRGYISSLMHSDINYNIHPISKPFHIHTKRGPEWIVNQFENLPDVVIIHLNPDIGGWSSLLDYEEHQIIKSARRRIGIFVWELSTLPSYWVKGLNTVDAIIAPSEYCAEIFRKYTTVPVYVVPHPVSIPVPALLPELKLNQSEDSRSLRERYSIPVDARLILYAFDGSSFLARKNPFALIRAFKASKLARMGWHLVLKTKHLFDVPERGEELLNAIGNSKSITIINTPLTPCDMDLLFEEMEIYASPHCSEGFGLTIAEAMSRGKIVVATNYGGSKDFLDATCGFPVKAKIVSILENFGPYQAGGQWAEIDEDSLSIALQQAADETNLVYASNENTMASRAIARVKESLSYSSVAEKLEYIVSKVHSDIQYSDRSRSIENGQ